MDCNSCHSRGSGDKCAIRFFGWSIIVTVFVVGVCYIELVQKIGLLANLVLDDREAHPLIAMFEIVCFGLAALLVVMYMCFEDACCHASVAAEHGYLSFVLAIIACAPWVKWFEMPKADGGMVDETQKSFEKLMHCMFATLVLRIAQSLIAPRAFDNFFKHRNWDSPCFADKPKRTQKGGRMVSQLQILMDDVLSVEAGPMARLSSGAFDMIMLFFFKSIQWSILFCTTST